MYTTFLFLLLCYFVPNGWSIIFEKVELPFLTPRSIFFIGLFVFSFVIIDLIILIFEKFKKKKIEIEKIKQKNIAIEKENAKRLQRIRGLDYPEKQILFSFIKEKTKSKILSEGNQYVSVLRAKNLIIDCGKCYSTYSHVDRFFHISPKYVDEIKKVYEEEKLLRKKKVKTNKLSS